MIQPVQKIELIKLKPNDFIVINNAVVTYLEHLHELKEELNYTDQHIHYSILYAFSFEINKRLIARTPAKKPKIKMELHTAIVLFDAFLYYDTICEAHQESAVLYRLKVDLHSEMPRTVDGKRLTIKSPENNY